MTDPLPPIPLFEGINDPQFQQAIAELPRRTFPKGMVIFDQGELSQEIFAVLSGSIEIVRQEPTEDLTRVAVLGPGNVFGEFSYLTGAPRSTAAVAMETTVLMELGPVWMQAADKRFPLLRERLLEIYRTRVLRNVLAQTHLFSTLPPAQLDTLAAQMTLREVKDGEELLREGTTGLDLIIIKRGRIRITKKKGDEIITLGALGPGDVLGEMAIVTGEPRSASAHASGNGEVMSLPGDAFRQVIATQPQLLQAIEDIIRSRAAETRKALDAVVADVVGEAWSDVAGAAGIQVASANVKVRFEAEGILGDGKLLLASRNRWTFERLTPGLPLPINSPVRLTLECHRVKELSAVNGLLIPAVVNTVEDHQVTVILSPEDEETERKITEAVTGMARARVRLFIYPEYAVEPLGIELEFQTRGGSPAKTRLLQLSQTHARVTLEGSWSDGEVAKATLRRQGKTLYSTRALSLGSDGERREIQFEYDTGAERSALEQLLRDFSRELGFGQVAAAAGAAAPKRSRFDQVISKHFPTPELFLKTYLGTMEAGLLQIEAKTKINRGTPVRLNTSISGKRGVHRFAFTGYVRQWNEGLAEVELDELAPSLREKIEQLCKKLIEDKSEASWQRRKKQLAESGVPIAEPSPAVGLAKMAAALVIVVGFGVWLTREWQNQTPVSTEEAQTNSASQTRRDETLSLNTTTGPITLRSSEIRSIQIRREGGNLTIKTAKQDFEVPAEETAKLSSFQRRQVEKFYAMRTKK